MTQQIENAKQLQQYSLTAADENDAPVAVVPLHDQWVDQSAAFSYEVPYYAFVDYDDSVEPTYSATLAGGAALPSWLSFDPTTRRFSGTPGDDAVGITEVEVSATDRFGASASAVFRITVDNVNDAPVVSVALADATAMTRGYFRYELPADSFTDADADTGDRLYYSATLANGDPLPNWLWFDNHTRSFSGYPSYRDLGVLDIKVTATDHAGASASDVFSLTVARDNHAPVVVAYLPFADIDEDAAFRYVVPENAFEDWDEGDSLRYSATLENGEALPGWMSFDAATRTFSGTPDDQDVGHLHVVLTATDTAGASASQLFHISIDSVNDAPVVSMSLPDATTEEDQYFSYWIPYDTFTDVDSPSPHYTARLANGDALPAWLAFDGHRLSGTPGNGDVGVLDVAVTATDWDGASASQVFRLTVDNVNDAPVVSVELADITADEDAAFSYVVPADCLIDPDLGDVLTFTATRPGGYPLPSWLAFDPATRTFSGTPGNHDVGSFEVEVRAHDQRWGTVADVFRFTVANVNDAPVVSVGLRDELISQGDAFQYVLPYGFVSDEEEGSEALSYSARLANGDALPDWLVFDADARRFSGTPGDDAVGITEVEVSATDRFGASASAVFRITVDNVNDAPVVSVALADATAMTREYFRYELPADSFTDADADTGDLLHYGASLANGDPLPDWLRFDSHTRSFSGYPSYRDLGVLDIKVTATDHTGASASDVFSLTVARDNHAPVVGAYLPIADIDEDAAFRYVVPENAFGDWDEGDSLRYSASLENGDALPGWLSFDAVTRTFSGTPDDRDVGRLHVVLTATDTAGASASQLFHISIESVNDAPVVSVALTDAAAMEHQEFRYVLPADSFTDADADTGDLLHYSATLANGDPLPDWLWFDNRTRSFSGYPSYRDLGVLDIRVTATDQTGASASDVFSLTVARDNHAPTVGARLPHANIDEDAAFRYVVPENAFQDWDEGDSLRYSATLENGEALPGWLSFDAATRTFSGTPDDQDVGPLRIVLTATDMAGASASQFFDISIESVNDAPVVSVSLPDETIEEDRYFSYWIPHDAFTDVDSPQLRYSARLANGDPLPAWLAFDGHGLSGTPGNGDVGVLDVAVTATDWDGASVSQVFRLTVTNVNDTPVVSVAVPDQTGKEGVAFSYTVPSNSFADVDAGDALTLSAKLASGAALPSWLSFDATTGTFSGTPPTGSAGTLNLLVTAIDQAGVSVSDNFNLAIGVASSVINGTRAAETLTGAAMDDKIFGLAGNDTLLGAGGNDSLDGGTGGDSMRGGLGNDIYIVDTSGDKVIENAGEGIDLVQSSVSLTLGNNVENLTLTGSSSITGTGNTLDNWLIGNSAANKLTGAAGNDTLDGGAGNDSLVGGKGNDSYLLNRGTGVDTVSENDTLSGNTDVIKTAADVASSQLWFVKKGSNLEVSVVGTADKFVIGNWYGGNAYHVEQFKSGDGKTLLDTQVDALVNAMAAFTPPAMGQTTLPTNYQTALDTVLAASWK